jgi:Na+/H+ antiporter NhaC
MPGLAVIKGGVENLTIETSGLGVFLQTIKYRYYPIFMIVLIPCLAGFKRDFGPMLIAERKVQVYERLDGGDGGTAKPAEGHVHPNAPRKDTPLYGHNMLVPIALLVFFIFYMLVKTGEDGSEQTFWDKLQGANSFSSLAWGTSAAVCVTFLFYVIQIVNEGKLALPTPKVLKGLFAFRRPSPADDGEGEEDDSLIEAAPPRVLMNLYDASESLLYGMGRIFPALIVLTLAWATGSIMTAVGVDRLFGAWIQNKLDPSSLPTLSFLISAIMALATGTSWGTYVSLARLRSRQSFARDSHSVVFLSDRMAIIFPLITIPTYEATGGDPLLVYATLAGVLSGAVSGDHASPISDTTVLSALASQCKLLAHVSTQAPYAVYIIIVSVLFGTLPIGRGTWPNIVGIILGAIFIAITVVVLGRPIVSKTGSYDIFTELILRCKPSEALQKLKQDTVDYYEGKQIPKEDSVKELDPDDSMLKEDVENGKLYPTESIDHDDVYVEGATKSLLGNESREEET